MPVPFDSPPGPPTDWALLQGALGWVLLVTVVAALLLARWRRRLRSPAGDRNPSSWPLGRGLTQNSEANPSEDRRRAQQAKPAQAKDPLTGLLARAAFEAAIKGAVWQIDERAAASAAAGRAPAPLAVFAIGLDDLRGINDAWDQKAGDVILVQVGERLTAALAAASLDGPGQVARVGGDQFALLAAADEGMAIAMAGHICDALARPFEIGSETSGLGPGLKLALTASVGVACYPAHGAWSRLLPHASAAMRHVRGAGGNGHAMYSSAMAVDLRDQALLLQDLRQAVERGQLSLLYQPKIDAASLQITAAEALLRWQHPVRGLVPPAVFVPLAERHGLIGPIGEWVVAEACRQAAAWRERGLRMRIAINISGHQLRHDRFVARLEEEARRQQIPPLRITCEITESVAMEDTVQTRKAFQRLRRAGFHVSIDDFGTGHSSLAVLRRLPAAELKVDRSFVVDLEVSESARSIVEAVIGVARTLGLRVVAEGVETEVQRDILVGLGCDELQGFLFARPMSATALALWAEGSGPGAAGAAATSAPEFRPSLFDVTKPVPAP